MAARVKDPANLSFPPSTRPIYWTLLPVSDLNYLLYKADISQWEVCPEPVAPQMFPPVDLLRDLVDIYFKQINIFWFILHRPTFEKSLADGLHLQSPAFGCVVLAVCALASKTSPDGRVVFLANKAS
ncbi:Fungal-trans domain-containing protein [Mycena sanguinolenta]|uniref:Fungal-trans domain-containing protein n=1 Tax=Mycena sanguinolenta TaxID=230812 RepID=A0A8H7D9N9_9AGAR|nr:Fungal-trans domain-containing protein [Mycena sanguinolenta]